MKFKEFKKIFNQKSTEEQKQILDKLYHYDIKYFKETFDIDPQLMLFLLSFYKLNKGLKWLWYTNGEDNICLPNTSEIPEGYKRGKAHAFKTTTKGKIWITNGKENHLVDKDSILPEGFYLGTSGKSTTDYIWVNNGVDQKLIPSNNIPEGFIYKGKINVDNYIKAAAKRKKTYYTNGFENIKLLPSDSIPQGFYEGKTVLSPKERIELRDKKYLEKGYIAVKNLTLPQLVGYVFYRDKTNELTDIISKKDQYTYINIKYLPLFEKYAEINHSKGVSGQENAFFDYIKSIYKGDIKRHSRDILVDENKKYYELDIYIPDKKIGIEYNGLYWHSEFQKDRNYHYEKSKLAEKCGIRLINIYEDEWLNPEKQDKIKFLLNAALGIIPSKIYARNCEVKQINNKEAKELNEKVHLQGHRNAQVTYGLFYEDELVQLMSFSKTKYNRNLKGDNDWEIIRGCPGSNNIVVGGVSKLFKHFLRDYNPDSVFSYCDFNKFDGKSYEDLGMKFIGYTGPNMCWIINGKRVARNPMKHKELKEKSQFRIFGSGSKKYRWERVS